MQVNNNVLQINNAQLEKILTTTQNQGTDLGEKLIKMNVMQQIDQSQLSYMGNIIDLYV